MNDGADGTAPQSVPVVLDPPGVAIPVRDEGEAVPAAAAPPPPPPPTQPPTQPPFTAISAGDTYDGSPVDFIYAATDEYIVFESQGRIVYAANEVPFLRQATALFHEYDAIAETELLGAFRFERRLLLGTALARAFEAQTEQEVRNAFEALATFIRTKAPVRQTFVRTPDFIVSADKEGTLLWEYPKLPEPLLPVVAGLESIQLAASGLSESDRAAATKILGVELSVAFRAGGRISAADALQASRQFIKARVDGAASNLYVIASFCAAIVLLVLVAGVASAPLGEVAAAFRSVGAGALGGMLGAWISILQRSSKLEIAQFTPRSQIVAQAAIRMVLGLTFGALVVIAVKAELLGGSFGNAYALFLLSVAAGVSERFVPDLLAKLSASDSATTAAPGK